MKRLSAAVVFCILFLFCWMATPQQASGGSPPFWSDLKAGPYAVGFRVLYDRERGHSWVKNAASGKAGPGRPIRISLWYPAVPSASDVRMTYGDYLHHQGPADFAKFNEQLDKLDLESWRGDVSELAPLGGPKLEQVLSTPVAAYAVAKPASGSFPLLLYSGGKGSRGDDNIELGEYLASWGFVVATVPQLGPSDGELELGSSPQEIALHADDMWAALLRLRHEPNVESAHFAAAGHSAGGEAAVELALRHREVTAVIGLDASYGMVAGARVFRQLPGYRIGRKVAAALLDLRRANGSQGVRLDLSAIDALRWNDLYRVTFEKGNHGDFTEWGMLAWKLSVPMPPNPDGHTRELGRNINRQVCDAIVTFLNAQLRGQKQSFDEFQASLEHEPGVAFSHPLEAGHRNKQATIAP